MEDYTQTIYNIAWPTTYFVMHRELNNTSFIMIMRQS